MHRAVANDTHHIKSIDTPFRFGHGGGGGSFLNTVPLGSLVTAGEHRAAKRRPGRGGAAPTKAPQDAGFVALPARDRLVKPRRAPLRAPSRVPPRWVLPPPPRPVLPPLPRVPPQMSRSPSTPALPPASGSRSGPWAPLERRVRLPGARPARWDRSSSPSAGCADPATTGALFAWAPLLRSPPEGPEDAVRRLLRLEVLAWAMVGMMMAVAVALFVLDAPPAGRWMPPVLPALFSG